VNAIYIDSKLKDDVRRTRLFEGQLFIFSPIPTSLALCEFARTMIQDASGEIVFQPPMLDRL